MSDCTCFYLPHAEWCAASTEHAAEIRKLCEDHRVEVETLHDMLRVSDEQNEALGDANVLSVENEQLRAKLSDAYAALVGYSEGEPGEELRRLIAQHAIDAAEIARGDIERAKLQAEHARLTHVGVTLNNAYSARLAIVEPVYEAAKAWRVGRDRSIIGTAPRGGQRSATGVALIDAVDAALAAEQKERGDG